MNHALMFGMGVPVNDKNLMKIVDEAFAIESETAKDAGTLGFVARSMTIATMPHRSIKGDRFERINGNFKLVIVSMSDIGLPFGNMPRLIMAWISTEAVRTKDRVLVLGPSLSSFMNELGLNITGGRRGDITRLKNQMQRLLSCSIACTYDDGQTWELQNVTPISRAKLWWNPKAPEQTTLWRSTLTLGEEFFNEVIKHPIPVDMRALKSLKRSPLALDIYCWMTYRMSYLRKPTTIPWESLQFQFGAGYPFTPQGGYDFKRKFLKHLKSVTVVYPDAAVESAASGLKLAPGKTHISKLR